MNIKLPNGAVHHVQAGDVLRYIDGRGETRTGAVLRYLTFPDHVVVSGRWCGDTVDARNFVRLVRRGRLP